MSLGKCLKGKYAVVAVQISGADGLEDSHEIEDLSLAAQVPTGFDEARSPPRGRLTVERGLNRVQLDRGARRQTVDDEIGLLRADV